MIEGVWILAVEDMDFLISGFCQYDALRYMSFHGDFSGGQRWEKKQNGINRFLILHDISDLNIGSREAAKLRLLLKFCNSDRLMVDHWQTYGTVSYNYGIT